MKRDDNENSGRLLTNLGGNMTDQKTLLKFKADQKSPTMDIGTGEYRRSFKADEQPFVVDSKEEADMLLRTGHFEKVEEPAAEEEIKVQSPKSKAFKKPLEESATTFVDESVAPKTETAD
jgi:hypothetical protein